MSANSIQRRSVTRQSLRLSQPNAWMDGLSFRRLDLNNNGSVFSASSTLNAPGAWGQIVSSSAISASDTVTSLHISGYGPFGASLGDNNSMLLDIAKGASGSEVIVAQDIAIGGLANSGGFGPQLNIPVRIAGATRIAVRVRAAATGRSLGVALALTSGESGVSSYSARLPTSVDTIGTSQSTSAGVAMTGASGTWTEITSATTKDYQALIIVPSGPGSSSGFPNTVCKLDLGIGAAGAEKDVAYCMMLFNSAAWMSAYAINNYTAIYGGFVPAGTRLAVRHNLSSSPQVACACVIGVPYV